MSARIGILGGTFDPIHCGHVDLGVAADRALELTELLVMPANVPPHRPQPVASSFHRFAMVALAVAGRARWQASDLELRRDARSYTSATLRRLHQDGYRPTELFFIVGADAFAEVATWKDYPAIFDQAHFAVVSRMGWPAPRLAEQLPALAGRMVRPGDATSNAGATSIFLIDAHTADVSSTAIRRLRAARQSIAGLVVPGVQQHIEQHGLYTEPRPAERGVNRAIDDAAGRLHGEN
jgi:nicotinate-nucleotide adenylyltransferase